VQWVSTLDSRTTEICIALDGLQWTLPDYEPIGHKVDFPGAIAHWGCRSTQIAVVKSWEELGGKPEITTANIEDFRGDVNTAELAKFAGNETAAFTATDKSQWVKLSKLISNKNELTDPKFLAGQKADPRQKAAQGMLSALRGEGAARKPLTVYRNADGTYTIIDGNATAQAAMLAKWDKVAVEVVPKPGTLAPDKIEALFRKNLAGQGFSPKEIDSIVAEKRLTITGEPAPRQSFDDFLKKQTKEFQDRLLGVQKAQLWRDGKITLNDLVDQSGRPLSVDELRAMVSKNEALPPVKPGQDGLGLMERKLLEESLVAGARDKRVVSNFIDMATGQKITVVGALPNAEELAAINKMQDVMILRNATSIGELWSPQEMAQFSQIKGFGGARIVTPDGRVVSLTMRPIADRFALTEARKINEAITSAMTSGKTEIAGLKAAVENSSLRFAQTQTGAVMPAAEAFTAPKLPEVAIREAAAELFQRAKIKDSAVTQIMEMAARESRGELAGLDFRLKTEQSLARKIALDMKDKGLPAGDAAAQISDALRYTIVLPEDRYSTGVKQALNALETKSGGGLKVVKVKNFWDGKSYEGINVKLETADGFKVELQFHTPATLLTKEERSHPIYELLRATNDPKAIKAYEQQLEDLWNDIPMPKGADKIGDDWREAFEKETADLKKALAKQEKLLGKESASIRKSIADSLEQINQSRAAYDSAWNEVKALMKQQDEIIKANQGGRLGTPEGKDALAQFERNKMTLRDLRIKTQQKFAEIKNEEEIAIAKTQNRLRVPAGAETALDVGREPVLAAMSEEGAQILSSIVPEGRLLNTSVDMFVTDQGRGYQVPGTGHIFLHPKESTSRTALHELGHWIETFNPEMNQACIDFLNKRTAGETAEKLSKLVLGSNYADYEIAKPDKFISPYMGKIYKDAAGKTYATEILSMGLEYLWFDPLEFARRDPEYFDFIYKLVKLVAPES
jgi:hypothetical protein